MPPVRLANSINKFPLQIGEWTGTQNIISSDIEARSGAEDSFSADYSCADKPRERE